MMRHIDPLSCAHGLTNQILRIKDADRHHFEKLLNRHNSEMVRRIAIKIDVMPHFDPLKPSDGQRFHLKKTKMADSRCPECPWSMHKANRYAL